MFKRHCNDELLIAFQDGELDHREQERVRAHLGACWRCRARLADLEEQVLGLARALERDTFPGPHRVAEAKSRLFQRVEEFERSSMPALQSNLLARSLSWKALAVAGGTLLCMAAPAVWHFSEQGKRPETPVASKRPGVVPRPQAAMEPPPLLQLEPPVVRPRIEPLFQQPRVVTLSAGREIEVRYALHRLRACLGEPIEIVRNAGGRLVVRAVVRTDERKAQLLAALAPFQGPPRLALDIQTTEEAVAAADRSKVAAHAASASRAFGEANPTESSSLRLSTERLPLQEQLTRYFSQDLPAGQGHQAGIARKIAQLADEAVSRSDGLLSEAWALRRLAERYGTENLEPLDVQPRWLLEAMVRDHLVGLRGQAGELRTLLEPVLSSAAGERGNPSEHTALGKDDTDWAPAVLGIFATAGEIHRSVFGLFGGAGLPMDARSGQAEAKSPAEVAGDLLATLARAQTTGREAEQSVAAAFSGKRTMAAGRNLPE